MKQIECLVIGAGIAGLSLAARLASTMHVTVIEGESAPGVHASGRSVAFVHFGLGERIVRSLTAASLAELQAMRSSDDEPLATRHSALHIARADQSAALQEIADVHEAFNCEYEQLSGDQAQALVPALTAGPDGVNGAILDHGALKLDTAAMLQCHLAELKAAGGSIVTGAKVNTINRAGDDWEVETSLGSFRAARIVNAAGAWADEVARMAGCAPVGIEPRRRTVISFDAPSDQDVSGWPFVKTVGEGFYMLPEGRGRLLASAMDQTPSNPCDAAPEELDIAIAADRVMNAAALPIRRIAHSWAGLRSFAPDELPVIGEAPGAPGFIWCAGQGGSGFQTSPALARVGEAAVLGLPFPADLTGYGLSFKDFTPARFETAAALL